MKKVFILIQTFIFFSTLLYSQIEYEGTLNSMVKTIQLNDGVIRYYTIDSKENVLTIFNLDKSVWKSISLTVPKGEFVDEIKLISQDVFNGNPQMEIVYTTVWYDLNNDSYEAGDGEIAPPNYNFFLIDETGNKLLEVKGGSEFKIMESKGKKKLLVFKNDGTSDFWSNGHTDVFALN